jgi:O-antigen biosynthesis protein WbqV
MLPTLAFLHDVIMAGIAFFLAMYLRLGGHFTGDYQAVTIASLPIFMGVAAVCFRVFRLYRGLWRFASTRDLVLLAQAVTLAVLGFVLILYYFHLLSDIPRSVPTILWFVLLILLGGPRFAYRMIKDHHLSLAQEGGRIPVILVGAGLGAEQFIRAMGRGGPYRVVGILDDEGSADTGRKMHGITILGDSAALSVAVASLRRKRRAPQRVVITKQPGEITGRRLGRLIDEAEALGLTVGQMPSLTAFQKTSEVPALTPIAIEDLLGRPQNILDRSAVEALVSGSRVVITGAGGTIGSELSRQVATLQPAHLTLIDQSEFNIYSIEMELQGAFPALALTTHIADVRDAARIGALFAAARPEIVFHAAALKHVPQVEKNVCEGILTNTIGTRIVADAALAVGARAMVQISTDKAVKPANVMGASKRLAEMYCQVLDINAAGKTRFMTVRFGNVLGSSGSVVPLFQRQIAAGGPITVTHPDVERYFMTCREAVQLVLQASAYGLEGHASEGRIFVLDMGEPVKIVDLARRMVVLSGLHPDRDIRIEFTGLRPGEKLTERLFESDETLTPTELSGVLSASPVLEDDAVLKEKLAALEVAARGGDDGKVLALIETLLPEFSNAHS